MQIFSEVPGLGRIYDCGDCGCIHLQIGPVNLSLEHEAYRHLVKMMNASMPAFNLHAGRLREVAPKLPKEIM